MKIKYLIISTLFSLGSFFSVLHAETPHPSSTANIDKILKGAHAQIGKTLIYDGSYVRLPYPNGDIPQIRGVCSDVVIRAFRNADIDFQQLLHQDMSRHFSAYPQNWGLKRPDSSIDHRRVPNLMTYFKRQGKTISATQNPSDYHPGDIVSWMLPGNLPHIGIVSDRRSKDGERLMIIHNIGRGAQLEDVLFEYPITGHVRFFQ